MIVVRLSVCQLQEVSGNRLDHETQEAISQAVEL